jgi:uncharacterized protein (DUF169 family)
MAETRLEELLALKHAPVALTFRDEPPAGVPRVRAGTPAGCGYWKLAAEGEVFYTEASDHYGCPVGAHTHGIDLPPDAARELEGLVETMVGLEYLSMAEVPSIPRRAEPFGVAVYAPLGRSPVPADVILVRGTARQIMLLAEAAQSAGAGSDSPAMGRPACSIVPQALQSGRTATSLGCIGNRVYTGLADDEFYFAIPGSRLGALTERLAVIANANRELEKFHRARASSIER